MAWLYQKIERLFNRPDFKRNPVKAITRRVWWRLRWWFNKEPWLLEMPHGLSVLSPRSGTGALIYYQGVSEPETAGLLERIMKPGMVFFDLGAHIGEYTLLVSRLAGDSGRVHSFEPDPDLFELLQENVTRNKLGNVKLNCCAVTDCDGEASFNVCIDPASSSIAQDNNLRSDSSVRRTIRIPTRNLDSYCWESDCRPRIIKADVEGAELSVLQGAQQLLCLPPEDAPEWILEYSPSRLRINNVKGPLANGHSSPNCLIHEAELFKTLEDCGYGVFLINPDSSLSRIHDGRCNADATCNIFASKRMRE